MYLLIMYVQIFKLYVNVLVLILIKDTQKSVNEPTRLVL